MTGASAHIVNSATHRASGMAWLALALVVLALVPVPAVAVAVRLGLPGATAGGVQDLLRALLLSTPLFALPPFVLGGGLGSFFHLVVTAPERFAALEAGRSATLNPSELVGRSLVTGAVLASCGLILAETLLRF